MHVRMNSVLSIMKFAVLFLLLTLAFDETESQKLSQEKVVCAKKDEVSINRPNNTNMHDMRNVLKH
jgi:hypothetical protein